MLYLRSYFIDPCPYLLQSWMECSPGWNAGPIYVPVATPFCSVLTQVLSIPAWLKAYYVEDGLELLILLIPGIISMCHLVQVIQC